MTIEAGHAPNRVYQSQGGSVHLNGGNIHDVNENALPQQVSFTIAKGGSANISLVTMQVMDGFGVAISQVFPFDWWLSDATTGAGLTATTASGAVAAGTSGTDLVVKVAKKATGSITAATGIYIASITDTAKTGFYVCCVCPMTGIVFVSRQLLSTDYD